MSKLSLAFGVLILPLALMSIQAQLVRIATAHSGAVAQTPQRDNRPRTASISGRVTIGGAPAANATVMVAEVDPRYRGAWPDAFAVSQSQQRSFNKVRTDSDGRYRVTGLTEGAYLIRVLSKAYVRSKNSPDFDTMKSVTLDEGESRDNVDIALVRGGVITGRVTDADGKPLIGSYLHLLPVDENGKPKERLDLENNWMMRTDDRGVYRIYGLPAGRYILSAGGSWFYSHLKRKYIATFYPDATAQNEAKIIEVKEGAEAANIDIRLGVGKSVYEAAGRVLDAETGQPVPQVLVRCLEAPDKENRERRSGGQAITDDEGRFRVNGLPAGRYDLGLWGSGPANGEYYGEKIRFEVNDSDVSGLEVKAIRGSTISGVVVLEGARDPAVKAKLQQMSVILHVTGKPGLDPYDMIYRSRSNAHAKIASDGGFRLTGASPGMASFYLQGARENIFSIERIERDGAEIRKAFEIRRGEQITGVRIVVSHANGTIRGQVEIVGGKLPESWDLHIRAAPIRTTTGDESYPAFHSGYGSAMADRKGRFVIEGLVAGEYEVTLNAIVRAGQNDWSGAPGISDVKQRITVSGGAETPVKLIFDPARKQPENRQ